MEMNIRKTHNEYYNNKDTHMNPIHDCFAKALPASAMILAA